MTNQAADRPPVDMAAFHAACEAATADTTQPVWASEPFWRDNRNIRADHYAHTSRNDPALLAYTQSPEKGLRGIFTPIKPGRYLTKFFSGVLSEREIAFYAAWQSTGSQGSEWTDAARYPMAFASDSADIVSVYERGPQSCMKEMSCVSVYGAGDLAVAYLTKGKDAGGQVLARALVWPGKKVIGRVYPSGHHWHAEGFVNETASQACGQALLARLIAEGYHADTTSRGFNGARLTREDEGNGYYTMPYLDHSYQVNDIGDHFEMTADGEMLADQTSGRLRIEGWEEEDTRDRCDRCGDRMEDDDTMVVYTRWSVRYGAHGQEGWCGHCAGNRTFTCEGMREVFSDRQDSLCIDGDTYHRGWAEANGAYECGHTSEGYFRADHPPVTMANGDTWSPESFRLDGFTCAITGGNYHRRFAHLDLHTVWGDVSAEDIAAHLAMAPAFETILDTNQLELTV